MTARRLNHLTATAVVGAIAIALSLGSAAPADADGCRKVKVGNFKIKKIRVSHPVGCADGRRVAKLWVKRDYDDFNPIHVGDNRWFCSWRRKAPRSQTTGSAECDADPGEELSFAVRHR